jgi:hypothetical protein
MSKKLIIAVVFAAAGLLASHVMSQDQRGRGDSQKSDGPALKNLSSNVSAPSTPRGPDVEGEIRNLYIHLQWEMRGENPDAALIERHAELKKVLTRYMAADRIAKAITELELIIREMPGSGEARKANAAIEALNASDANSPESDRR